MQLKAVSIVECNVNARYWMSVCVSEPVPCSVPYIIWLDALVSSGLCDLTQSTGCSLSGRFTQPFVLNCLGPKLATAYKALMSLA